MFAANSRRLRSPRWQNNKVQSSEWIFSYNGENKFATISLDIIIAGKLRIHRCASRRDTCAEGIGLPPHGW
jgi:hypothetical protein